MEEGDERLTANRCSAQNPRNYKAKFTYFPEFLWFFLKWRHCKENSFESGMELKIDGTRGEGGEKVKFHNMTGSKHTARS